MLARRKLRRRIDDALAVASPLALAEAMDAHIAGRSSDDLRGLISRSAKRMDGGERAQLELYLNPNDPDDLLGHRFSAFLRQNPRAIAALDGDAVDAILRELGEMPQVEHVKRRLPAPAAALVTLVLAVALLPLVAQYTHQRGLLQGLTDPVLPPVIVPFVQRVSARPAARPHHALRVARRPAKHVRVIAKRPKRKPPRREIAARPRVHRTPGVAWKFDRRNNPYFNHARWRHPYIADASTFGARARLTVKSYLRAIIAGNFPAALAHLGMPADADSSALAELPIVARGSAVAIVGSKPQSDGKEQVQADITTRGREYYEVFYVAHDGPAVRIVDRYYIPVNRPAEVAVRLHVQRPH